MHEGSFLQESKKNNFKKHKVIKKKLPIEGKG